MKQITTIGLDDEQAEFAMLIETTVLQATAELVDFVEADSSPTWSAISPVRHDRGPADTHSPGAFAIHKRGGRKLVITPDGTETGAPVQHRVDNTMVKALARGFRWRKLLDAGVYGSIDEIAAKEKIDSSYVGRPLRMTLLAPNIVEAILDGRQPAEVTLNHRAIAA